MSTMTGGQPTVRDEQMSARGELIPQMRGSFA